MGKKEDKEYDVVVYDGFSSDEICRMFGSAERARCVFFYLEVALVTSKSVDQ